MTDYLIDVLIMLAMMALPVALGISARFFCDKVLHTRNKLVK